MVRELADKADQKALRERPFVVRPVRNLPTKSEQATPEGEKKESSSPGGVAASVRPSLPPERS